MAGMLPGVECARRRRCHQSGGTCFDSSNIPTRRSTFCLYASNHDSRFSSSSSLRRSLLYQANTDENMVGIAREAKQRLDNKFRGQNRVSENKRENCVVEGRRRELLQTEVYGGSKSKRRFNWGKLSCRVYWEQEDCAVCLESFRVGDTLMNLPCAHRFHSRCLTPWLDYNSNCPCCRTTILLSL